MVDTVYDDMIEPREFYAANDTHPARKTQTDAMAIPEETFDRSVDVVLRAVLRNTLFKEFRELAGPYFGIWRVSVVGGLPTRY